MRSRCAFAKRDCRPIPNARSARLEIHSPAISITRRFVPAPERAGDTGASRPARPALRRMLYRAAMRTARVLMLTYVGACALLYFDQRNLLYFAADTHVAASDTNFALRNDGLVLR